MWGCGFAYYSGGVVLHADVGGVALSDFIISVMVGFSLFFVVHF